MARVYLETSFVSACVTNRTDVASLYRRQASLEWWKFERLKHELFGSDELVAELSHPRYPLASQALDFISGCTIIAVTSEMADLAEILVREKVMPAPLRGDAMHIAMATIARMQYLFVVECEAFGESQ